MIVKSGVNAMGGLGILINVAGVVSPFVFSPIVSMKPKQRIAFA